MAVMSAVPKGQICGIIKCNQKVKTCGIRRRWRSLTSTYERWRRWQNCYHDDGDDGDDDGDGGDDGDGDDDGTCDDDDGNDGNDCKVREMARAKMFGRPGNGAPTG